MKTKIKKLFSATLIACMLLTLVPLNATEPFENSGTISSEKLQQSSELEMYEDSIQNEEGDEQENQNLESNIEEYYTIDESIIESLAIEDDSMSNNLLDNDSVVDSNENILESKDESSSIESEEPQNDNWELGLVFYDSSIDNGKTPLTEINWDASDGGYDASEPRVITVQINYKNSNAIKTYLPGELKIDIYNLTYWNSNEQETMWEHQNYLTSNVVVGANYNNQTGYDWDLNNYKGYGLNSLKSFVFSNSKTIDEKTNFQGSIQMTYSFQSKKYPTPFEDEYDESFYKLMQASLNNNIFSNEIEFDYYRKYIHPWKKREYPINIFAEKISSYDGLGEAPDKYIWVKYTYFRKYNQEYNYPYEYYPEIYTKSTSMTCRNKIPDGCVAYSNENLLEVDDEGYINVKQPTSIYSYGNGKGYGNYSYVYIGYPKEIYKDKTIFNEVELWGIYRNNVEFEFLSNDAIDINLSDYEFSYTGELYGINKIYYFSKNGLVYQDIVNKWSNNYVIWGINPSVVYSGTPLTLKIGDDILFATSNDGNPIKLKDDEYYFSEIKWLPNYFLNGNNNIIKPNKYDCELWVRYKYQSDYILFDTFKNPDKEKKWILNTNDVVGFYFIVDNLVESINGSTYSMLQPKTIFIKDSIPQEGTLYNFDYLQVFTKDNIGNLILQNEPGLDSYSNFITQNDIASFDLNTYGNYMQRSYSMANWKYYTIQEAQIKIFNTKSSSVTQNQEKELFNIDYRISTNINAQLAFEPNYKEQYDTSQFLKGFKTYDLLPLGMEISSSEEDIINSLSFTENNGYGATLYGQNLKRLSKEEITENTKTNVNIIKNWNNTNRTKIEIITEFKEPVWFFSGAYGNSFDFNYKFSTNISYDNFLIYGNIWTNYCYTKLFDNQKHVQYYRNKIYNTGIFDNDAENIDENNKQEAFVYYKNTETILTAISTHQDVQKSVKTDQSNYSTGTVKSSYDSEYEYKLRVRTGQNDITNLIIYDSIEEYAQNPDGDIVPAYGSKKHWNGKFLGVDTSYAESKGYKVKVYYSEDVKAGNLADDSSWKEYSEATVKSKVKSLAFEYLDAEGNPAKLPANSLTYVLIKMKSPADESITSLAYNGCRTQWNALDDYDMPVDFITGINSNIVKVSLPNSVEDKEVNLHFNKMISGSDETFEKLKLNKDNGYNFYITLENQDTGDTIKGTVNNKDGFAVNNVPIGTYIIKEIDDIWFQFVSMALNESIEGIEFKEESGRYVIIISTSVESGTTANIDITNKTDEERFYDKKYDVKNLFNPTT